MSVQETRSVRSAYADKVAADLAENKAEQERIRAEIEALQAHLTTLEADHALLETMSVALGEAGGVPAPRPSRKSTSTTPTKKTASKKAPEKKTGEKTSPLAHVIHQHLIEQSEPRTAREITQALTDAHPGRNLNDNLVRTTTERLVARGQVERAKQGATVYYVALKAETAQATALDASEAAKKVPAITS
jgi:predicted transcriptional regulator